MSRSAKAQMLRAAWRLPQPTRAAAGMFGWHGMENVINQPCIQMFCHMQQACRKFCSLFSECMWSCQSFLHGTRYGTEGMAGSKAAWDLDPKNHVRVRSEGEKREVRR